MKKFINHVDHVAYISKWETVEANVAQLEALTDAKMERSERNDLGCVIYVDWSAGLEIVAPMPEEDDRNQALHKRLRSHGEGLFAMIYGVENLEAYKAKMEAKGLEISPLVEAHPDDPWFERLVLRERYAPQFMNTWMVYSQIDYPDDEIRIVDVAGQALDA